MKKFKIVIYSILAIIIFIILYSVVIAIYSLNTNTVVNTEFSDKEIKEITEIKMKLSLEKGDESSDYKIIGKTNLPSGTNLTISFVNKDNSVIGGGYVNVKEGIFILDRDINFFKTYIINVNIINNEHNQSPKIIKQLEFMMKETKNFDFNIELLKEDFLKRILNFVEPQNIKLSKIESIKDVSLKNIKRISLNVIVEDNLSEKEIENHVKYHIINQIKQDNNIAGIFIKCFYKGNDISFKNYVFAPFGDWSKSIANSGLNHFQFK